MASRIDRIKSTMSESQAEYLVRQWIPGGKRKGRAYIVKSPFRAESTPSFYVYLTPTIGCHDYGGDFRGDLIDLCQALYHVGLKDALEAFEQMLGIDREVIRPNTNNSAPSQ